MQTYMYMYIMYMHFWSHNVSLSAIASINPARAKHMQYFIFVRKPGYSIATSGLGLPHHFSKPSAAPVTIYTVSQAKLT